MTKIKVRKMLAAVLALVFVLSVFASCGKKKDNGPTKPAGETVSETEPTTDNFSVPPIEDDESESNPASENASDPTKAPDNSTKPTQSTEKPTQSNVKPTEKPTQNTVKPTEKPTQSQKPTEAPTQSSSKDVYKTAYFKASTGEKIQYTSYMLTYFPNSNVVDTEHTYKAYEKNGIVYTVDEEGTESVVKVKCNKCNSYLNCKCDPYVHDKCGKHNCHRQLNGGECYGCGKLLKAGECHECPNAPVEVCPHCGYKGKM